LTSDQKIAPIKRRRTTWQGQPFFFYFLHKIQQNKLREQYLAAEILFFNKQLIS